MTAQTLRARWLELDDIADHVNALYEKGGCNERTAIEACEKCLAAYVAYEAAMEAEAGSVRELVH